MAWIVAHLWAWAAFAAAFMIGAAILPKVEVRSWGTAFGAALVFGILNILFGWLLGFLARVLLWLPNVLTFGLVRVVIPVLVNMVLLFVLDTIVERGIQIRGVWSYAGLAALLAITSAFVF